MQGQARGAISQGLDCRRSSVRVLRHPHRFCTGPGNLRSRPALAYRRSWFALARRSFLLRPQIDGTACDQQSLRHSDVRATRGLALLFRPQKARLAAETRQSTGNRARRDEYRNRTLTDALCRRTLTEWRVRSALGATTSTGAASLPPA